MQVWDSGSEGFVRYDASEVGAEDMGYVAENSLIQAALLHRLCSGGRAGKNVELMPSTEVASIQLPPYLDRPQGKSSADLGPPLAPSNVRSTRRAGSDATPGTSSSPAEVHLKDGRVLSTKLLVGADGGNSR